MALSSWHLALGAMVLGCGAAIGLYSGDGFAE
jgi:hypothetical protein